MNRLYIDFFSRQDALQNAVKKYRIWIEQKLARPLEECVLIDVETDLAQIALERVLKLTVPHTSVQLQRLSRIISTAEIPSDALPIIGVSKALPESVNSARSLALAIKQASAVVSAPSLIWKGCPVQFMLDGDKKPAVALRVAWNRGPGSTRDESSNLLIVPRQYVDLAIRFIGFIDRQDRRPKLVTCDGETQPVAQCSWQELTLDPQIIALLKNDIDFFMKNRRWFLDANLPHRRGYLLHGPPGNGKTSAVRCMMNAYGLSAYTLRLFNRFTDDATLDDAIDLARKNSPAILLLEDLDRAFPGSGESKCNISLQYMLNALDGIATGDGIITIATANEPSLLDPAILRRPGRFDRVVYFASPSLEMRTSYLAQRLSCAKDAVAPIAEAADGFSFAQLKEAFILAGQRAFSDQRDIVIDDLVPCIEVLRKTMIASSRHSRASGF